MLGLGLGLTTVRRPPGGAPPPASDADALAYIAAVEAADGQDLEPGVITAIDAFVVGLKAYGLWSQIGASCILAGARTLPGALVPLRGPAPTSFNFVAADYNRLTGLKGDKTTKYMNSNYGFTSAQRSNAHLVVWRTEAEGTGTQVLAGNSSDIQFVASDSLRAYRINDSVSTVNDTSRHPGIVGVTRPSTNFTLYRYNGVTIQQNTPSTSVNTSPVYVFSRAVGAYLCDARFAFYSMGDNVDLALLDARIGTFLAAIQGALP